MRWDWITLRHGIKYIHEVMEMMMIPMSDVEHDSTVSCRLVQCNPRISNASKNEVQYQQVLMTGSLKKTRNSPPIFILCKKALFQLYHFQLLERKKMQRAMNAAPDEVAHNIRDPHHGERRDVARVSNTSTDTLILGARKTITKKATTLQAAQCTPRRRCREEAWPNGVGPETPCSCKDFHSFSNN